MKRRPYAAMGASSRERKARKIAQLLDGRLSLEGASVLDVGTGAGYIAAHFSSLVGPTGVVWGVDRIDQRRVTGFGFREVPGLELPFPSQSFDLCIYNHVIEHVGERPEQAKHLRELLRVLKPGGVLYVAVPNRFAVVEPHFKLPFLSWLPARLADRYVAVLTGRDAYDCAPLTSAELASLLNQAGFVAENVTWQALTIFLREERPRLARWLRALPDEPQGKMEPLYVGLASLLPTIAFVATRPGTPSSASDT